MPGSEGQGITSWAILAEAAAFVAWVVPEPVSSLPPQAESNKTRALHITLDKCFVFIMIPIFSTCCAGGQMELLLRTVSG